MLTCCRCAVTSTTGGDRQLQTTASPSRPFPTGTQGALSAIQPGQLVQQQQQQHPQAVRWTQASFPLFLHGFRLGKGVRSLILLRLP